MRDRILPKLAHPKLQRFWERSLALSLRGMNIGGGDFPATSGELAILRTLPPSATVFDVGANRGLYARSALTIRPDLVIYAFEPSAVAFADLQRNAGIRAYNFGLGERTETVPLYSDASGSPLASIYPRHVPGVEFRERETVPLRRLDEFCNEEGVAHIDLLKVDAEGHELAVLRGMGEVRPARIQFEFGGQPESRTFLRDFFDLLTPRYEIYRILPKGIHQVSYSARMEQFNTTNFLAVLL